MSTSCCERAAILSQLLGEVLRKTSQARQQEKMRPRVSKGGSVLHPSHLQERAMTQPAPHNSQVFPSSLDFKQHFYNEEFQAQTEIDGII